MPSVDSEVVVTTRMSPGWQQLDGRVDHQVVAGLARDGDRAARGLRRRIDRPHVRTHQPRAALRFVDGGDAELAERLDDAGVGALNVSNDRRFHVSTSVSEPLPATLVDPRIHLARVAFEDLLPVRGVERRRGVDVALGVVEVVARLRIDAAHRADHLRPEQDVVRPARSSAAGRCPAGGRRRCRRTRCCGSGRRAAAASCPAPGRDSGPSGTARAPPPCGMMNRSVGKSLNRSAVHELHERRRVGVDVVRAGGVEVRVARRADVHHRRHVELDHLLVERIPVPVGQRRRAPVAARRIGIQVAADEAELVDAALELARCSWRADRPATAAAGTRRRSSPGYSVQTRWIRSLQCSRPVQAGRRVADVVRHRRRARREDRDVGAALALQLQLRALEALADLVVADVDGALRPRGAAGSSARRSARRETPAAPSAPSCSARGSR